MRGLAADGEGARVPFERTTMMHAVPSGARSPARATPSAPARAPCEVSPRDLPDAERLRLFGEELDGVKERVMAKVGAEDLAYVRGLCRFSRAMEVLGRTLIFVSPDPVTFGVGVAALWLHKQVETTEIGHTVLHGAYDKLDPDGPLSSKKFHWRAPVDEESWRYAHNVRHHGYTNIAGRDADMHFGQVRLTAETPPEKMTRGRLQLVYSLGVIFPNFMMVIGSHVCGLNDVFGENGWASRYDFLPDRSKESVRAAWKRGLRKYVPYYLKEYAFWPALAGPLAPKVALGNFLAGLVRNVYTAATIFCGHVGEDVKAWPAGTKAKGRGQWYAMQVEAANNYQVSRPISVLCGGLDLQIEHHLFPTLAPQRLREIAPEVRAICEKYGVNYKTDTWGRTLKKVFRYLDRLSRGGALTSTLRSEMT